MGVHRVKADRVGGHKLEAGPHNQRLVSAESGFGTHLY